MKKVIKNYDGMVAMVVFGPFEIVGSHKRYILEEKTRNNLYMLVPWFNSPVIYVWCRVFPVHATEYSEPRPFIAAIEHGLNNGHVYQFEDDSEAFRWIADRIQK